MNLLRTLVEAVADRIRASGDAERRAYGLTVQRLPWGRRRVYDPRVVVWLDQRRARAAHQGLDAADRALLDPATRALLAATAHRLRQDAALVATVAEHGGQPPWPPAA